MLGSSLVPATHCDARCDQRVLASATGSQRVVERVLRDKVQRHKDFVVNQTLGGRRQPVIGRWFIEECSGSVAPIDPFVPTHRAERVQAVPGRHAARRSAGNDPDARRYAWHSARAHSPAGEVLVPPLAQPIRFAPLRRPDRTRSGFCERPLLR